MGGGFTKTDIGHGRGWLAPAPARSLKRIDAHMMRVLNRRADINEAGRSPEKANENRRKWLAYERYLNGGPWAPKAPYALGADQSVHCWGYAADSDDWYNNRAAAIWREHGWRQTARYPGNPRKDEPWHGEYSLALDKHRNDPATPAATLPEPEKRDIDMRVIWNRDNKDDETRRAVVGELTFHVQGPEASKRERVLWGEVEDVSEAEWQTAIDMVNTRRAMAGLKPLKGVRGEFSTPARP